MLILFVACFYGLPFNDSQNITFAQNYKFFPVYFDFASYVLCIDNLIVFFVGKGHEDYQVIGTAKLPFSDRTEAEGALAAWSAS